MSPRVRLRSAACTLAIALAIGNAPSAPKVYAQPAAYAAEDQRVVGGSLDAGAAVRDFDALVPQAPAASPDATPADGAVGAVGEASDPRASSALSGPTLEGDAATSPESAWSGQSARDTALDMAGFAAPSLGMAEVAAVGSSAADADGFAVADPDGFAPAELGPVSPATATTEVPSSPWSLSGTLRSRDAIATRADALNRVARLRQSLDVRLAGAGRLGAGTLRLVASVHAEYDFAQLVERDQIADSTLDVYERQLIFQENYLAFQLRALELAVGRQIVNWGQGEVLNLLDVINPRDLREPGLADLSDLRMAVFASRAGLTLGAHRLELVVVHEPYFGLRAPPLGTFSPLRSLLLGDRAFASAFGSRDLEWTHHPEHEPFELRANQPSAHWSFSGEGYDLALQAGSVLDNLGVAALASPEALSQRSVELLLYHPRYELVGHSGAATWGSFLLRWEASAELERPLQTRLTGTPFLQFGSVRRTQLNVLLGLSYLGRSSDTATLELLQAYVLDNPERERGQRELLMPVEATQLAFRSERHFLADRLSLSLLLLVVGLVDFNSLAGRVELAYAPSDGLKLLLAYMGYYSRSQFGPFYGFERNEQVYLGVRWDFAVQ